jgi:hypothetical protein
LGDVLLTEPLGRYFRAHYDQVFLATGYPHARHLIGHAFTGFLPYTILPYCTSSFDGGIIDLEYERYPELNYIDGYARAANITLDDRTPVVNRDWPVMKKGDYVLLAPGTSPWMELQRNWGYDNFNRLKEKISMEWGLPVVVLDPSYNFTEMLSLIRHCRLFVGSDSGPGIIAQCFQKESIILFGCTNPRTVLFSPKARPVFHEEMYCIGCKPRSNYAEIICGSPVCLTGLEMDVVFRAVSDYLQEIL